MEDVSTDTPSEPAVTVSIVLPTFNRLKYLPQAIESVFSQTFEGWELLIADDGSDEDARAYLRTIAQRSRVKVIWLSHSGNPAAVRNAALRMARGDYVAFLDSDDVWLPRKLQVQLDGLLASKDCQWSYTGFILADESLQPLASEKSRRWHSATGKIFHSLLRERTAVALPTVMVARRLIERAGGFDERQRLYEDYDLWLRLALLSEVGVVREPLACIRKHGDHYKGAGLRVPLLKQQLIEKLQAVVQEPALLRALAAEKAANAAKLARSYAIDGSPGEALRTLSSSLRYSWKHGQWWYGAAKMALRLLLPRGAS